MASSNIINSTLGGLGSLVTAPLRMYITQLVRDQLALYLREDCMDFERLTLDGTLTLQNLEFKLDVLRDALDIPQTLEITRAFIRTLQVNVPWTNLTGQPISVKVDTVMIVLKLKTDEELQSTAEASSSNTTSSKTTDATSNSSSGRPEPQPTERPSDEGWIASLVKRVVANTSLSIKDVIFKFDDGDGRVLTATLNSLNIFSADPRNRWSVSSFFEPEGDQKRVCKAASARGLSIRLDRSTAMEKEEGANRPKHDTSRNSGSGIRNSDRRKKRKHEHEVPVLRRANISVRGWFSLAPVHVAEKKAAPTRTTTSTAQKKTTTHDDPFQGYNGWHNGKEEVRGHPATVLDIHCSRLRFALSETQVDTMMKINDKVEHATVVLTQATARVVQRQREAHNNQKTESTAKTVMTTNDVKAMLNAASYKVEQEEIKRKMTRNEMLYQEKQQEKQRVLQEQTRQRARQQAQQKLRNHPTTEHEMAEEEGGGGVVTGLLSWAWNSLVGEDEYEDSHDLDNGPETTRQLVRSFRVIGFRFDHIGVDFLLHVRGHQISDHGPLHLKYPSANAASVANAVNAATAATAASAVFAVSAASAASVPPHRTLLTVQQRPRTSSETAMGEDEDEKQQVNLTTIMLSPEMSPQGDSLSPQTTPKRIPQSSPQHMVKVRTPGGYVEVDMSDNNATPDNHDLASLPSLSSFSASASSIATPTTNHYDTSRESRSSTSSTSFSKPSPSSSSFSSSSISSNTASSAYVSRERYSARHSRERVEAFASLQFSGIEYETRSHTLIMDMEDGGIPGATNATTAATMASSGATLARDPPQDITHSVTDTLSLLEIRSIGMWSTSNMTRSVELSTDRHVTLPNYLFLCGESVLHDCDGVSSENQTRLSSLSTVSLSPPPSPSLHPLNPSPRIGTMPSTARHYTIATPPPMRLSTGGGSAGMSSANGNSSARSLLHTPGTPGTSRMKPSSSSHGLFSPPSSSSSTSSTTTSGSTRRSSTTWLEWIAQPFLPRRIGLNLPPPTDSLPPVDEVVKNTSVSGQGRAFRMRTVTLHGGKNKAHNEHNEYRQEGPEGHAGQADPAGFEQEQHTSMAIGHCTARLDPDWIADMRVLLNPVLFSESHKNTESRPGKASKNEEANTAVVNTVVHKKPQTQTNMDISMEGIGMWMVLEAPTEPPTEPPTELPTAKSTKPAWCLLESNRILSSKTSSSTASSLFTFEHVCLCTGTLSPSIGETGFHRGLATQLASFNVRQNIHDTPKYWQLQSTGLFRTDYNTQLRLDEVRANKWPIYTMSSTNDGAPVLSNRKDILVIHNVAAATTPNEPLKLQKGGTWRINVDAGEIPFLSACWAAMMDATVVENDMLYWVRTVEHVARASGGGGGSGDGGHPLQQQQQPTPLEEEVVRLRMLLHEAREEAERWKSVVENGLSA